MTSGGFDGDGRFGLRHMVCLGQEFELFRICIWILNHRSVRDASEPCGWYIFRMETQRSMKIE